MSAKHTPGPWRVRPVAGAIKVTAGNPLLSYVDEVCAIDTDENDTANADARLIAAAPEMLEALEAVLSARFAAGCSCPGEWVDSTKGESRRWEKDSAFPCEVCRARAAIAKAKGEP